MTTASVKDLVTEYLPTAIESNELPLNHIKYSFAAGFIVFLLLLPFCRSRKSFFDAIAARRIIGIARLFIFSELLLLFVLYYFYFENGPPLEMHEWLTYGNGDSWLYTYGRPTGGIVFIGLGMLGEMHPVLRIMCILGCMGEILGDALSAYQVRDYYKQVKYFNAPSHGYTSNEMLAYYWRDIVSLGVCVTVLMLMGLLTVLVGICEPQLIHPSLISGKELDRYASMRINKEKRKIMASDGLLGQQKDGGLGVYKVRLSAKIAKMQSIASPGVKENPSLDQIEAGEGSN